MKPNSLTVTIVPHPKGYLMRIEHDGASMVLDSDEVNELYEQLHAKIGMMPVNLKPDHPQQPKTL